MKTINWSSIKGYDAWNGTLVKLLDAAATASAANDDEERLEICDALGEFIDRSSPNTPEIMDLDALASEAVQSMTEKIATDAVARIAARTTKLTSLSKQVLTVAGQVEKSAAALRLTQFHAAIDALTDAQRAVEGLDDIVKTGTDEQLRERLKALLEAIEKTRGALEKNK
jgi:hypothetical protein